MAAKTAAAPAEGEAPAKKKKLPLLIGVVVAVVAVAAAAWFFLLRPDPAAAAEEEPPPEPGAVVALDPVSINLADGAYLRLGLALQQTVEAAEEVEGSQALDAAIALFSGRSKEELADPATRDALKKELTEEVSVAYDEAVYEVYFTEFVTQ